MAPEPAFENSKDRFAGLRAALDANPDGYGENRDMAFFLMGLRNYALHAEPCIRKALAFAPGGSDEETLRYHLAVIHNLKGDFAAVRDAFHGLAADFPDNLNYRFSLVEACFMTGDLERASDLASQGLADCRRAVTERAADLDEGPVEILYPSAVVCRSYGEMASKLDLFLKARALGLLPDARILLPAPAGSVVNPSLLSYFAEHIEVVSEAGAIADAERRYGGNWRMLDYYPMPDGRSLPRHLAYGVIQQMWEADGRDPVLSLRQSDRTRGEAALAGLGLPAGAWFVALHVREPGFFNEDADSGPNRWRNVRIEAYGPAIEEIAARGGWVVRLGAASAPPLPAMPGLIDYAHSAARSDWMDVYLAAACRFFVGADSGPVWVAGAFGVPVVATDWFVLGVWPTASKDIFIHKRLVSEEDGRALPISACVAPGHYSVTAAQAIEQAGVRVVDNSADEIRAAVAEMLDRLDGSLTYTAEEEHRQEVFRAQADPFGVGIISRVGRDFLHRHPQLLDVDDG